jgi:hypothetical protein
MRAEQLLSPSIAECRGLRGRLHDVGEKDGGEHTVGLNNVPFTTLPDSREEPLDLVSDKSGINEPSVTLPGSSTSSAPGTRCAI